MTLSSQSLHGDPARSGILEAISKVIADFISGRHDIADLQETLTANASALDNRFPELVAELRLLDADLEEIRFAMHRDGQRRAAIFRLERTCALVPGVTDSVQQDDQ